MNAVLEFFQAAGLFLLGLLIRFAALIVVIAVFAIPVLALYALYVGVRWLRARQLGLVDVNGLELADARYYAPGHAWLSKRSGGRLRVGLDDLAQRLLPHATAVKLPRAGAPLAEGLPAVTITCGLRTATIPAPITGTVTAVNEALSENPDLLHTSPYSRGWLFTMKPATASYLGFPTGNTARTWFRKEEGRLASFLERELGLAAADGGELVVPAPALLPEEKWQALVASFLRP
jgi:glycine cleavage system H lipoate-binding protein